MDISWCKQSNGQYYTLFDFEYGKITSSGVYLIWAALYKERLLKVGQGNPLGQRMNDYQSDFRYKEKNRTHGPVLITWAEVRESCLDGVEAYLGKHYQPLFSERFPDAPLISVNLPL
jgi:hypothetical protein